jgi:hypothetical protein
LTVTNVAAGTLYVPRARQGADAMAALLRAGLDQPIALFGPAGSGKSTELSALAIIKDPEWVGSLIRLDREMPYSDSTSVDDVLKVIAARTVSGVVQTLKLRLSETLQAQASGAVYVEGFDVLLAAVREIQVASQSVVALLIDGLEKASNGLARRVLSNLQRLSETTPVRIVVVAPTAIATGPSAGILQDYHLEYLGPVIVATTTHPTVTPELAEDGVRFLLAIAEKRLGSALSEDLDKFFRFCAELSGGLPRTFLQLAQRAALSAAMNGRELPNRDDAIEAARYQSDFLMRLLQDGDAEQLRGADGTKGLEVEIERRVRFLANGLLLEYRTPGGPVVRVAPLMVGHLSIR